MSTLKFLGSPVTHSEYSELRANCYRSYHYLSGPNTLVCPRYINPLINIQVFLTYINNINPGTEGVRFYPGFENDTLILSMCHDKCKTVDFQAQVWSTLSNNLYLNPNSVLSTKDQAKAKLYKDNYDKNIYINGLPQLPGDRTRTSRFYTFAELEKLITDNVSAAQYSSHFIQIEWGMVYDNMTSILNGRCPVDNPNQHYGFTVLFHIKDEDGNPMINTNQEYEANQYSRTYLEVGSPCPPRCGII
ncbi:MAG: hypothetical protein KBH11_11510 [Bacteroidia bacterium]|nr:hypothetical protein [Bacteroidia bacterium]